MLSILLLATVHCSNVSVVTESVFPDSSEYPSASVPASSEQAESYSETASATIGETSLGSSEYASANVPVSSEQAESYSEAVIVTSGETVPGSSSDPVYYFPWSGKAVPFYEVGIYAGNYQYISPIYSNRPIIELLEDREMVLTFLDLLQNASLSFTKRFVRSLDVAEDIRGEHRFPDGTILIVLGTKSLVFFTCVYIKPSGQIVVNEMFASEEDPQYHEQYVSQENAVDYDAFLWMVTNDSEASVYQRAMIGAGFVYLLRDEPGSSTISE